MLSSNSSSCNQESNPNYTQFFPENDVAFSLFEYQDFYLQFLDLFSHHQQAAAATMAAGPNQNDVVQAAVRSSKKDRHSKITTARGPRDRRMRLSLEIARKFFDLQDLLGYDKASRTVEWLLRNSGAAIDELARARNASSDQSSTCEEVVAVAVAAAASGKSRKMREKVKREVRRARVGREERRKARERARERTSQKKRLTNQSSSSSKEAYVSELAYDMRPWNPSDGFNAVFLNNQEEQIVEFELSGKPWEAFNSFNLSG